MLLSIFISEIYISQYFIIVRYRYSQCVECKLPSTVQREEKEKKIILPIFILKTTQLYYVRTDYDTDIILYSTYQYILYIIKIRLQRSL
jgi:hypothetical protein